MLEITINIVISNISLKHRRFQNNHITFPNANTPHPHSKSKGVNATLAPSIGFPSLRLLSVILSINGDGSKYTTIGPWSSVFWSDKSWFPI